MARIKNKKKNIVHDNDILIEIISIIIIAISFLIMLSLFSSAGIVGFVIKNVLNGMFGVGAYLLPFIFLAFGVYFFLTENKIISMAKIYATIIIFFCAIVLMHIINFMPNENLTGGFLDYISFNYINGSANNGGLMGAIIGDLFINILGKIGAYIFLSATTLISIIMLTNKSFFKFLSRVLNGLSKKNSRSLKIKKDKTKTLPPMQKKISKPKFFTIEEKKVTKKESINENNTPENDLNETKKVDTVDVKLFGDYEENDIEETKSELKCELNMDEQTQQDDYDFSEYQFPPIDLLNKNTSNVNLSSRSQILETSKKLEETLKSFNVDAKVVEISKGPTVTRYELAPGKGVKVSKIASLADDLALSLAAAGIRIEAPVPGKSVVGIEVPNEKVDMVYIREIIASNEFQDFPAKLTFGIGRDISGKVAVCDISKMPHLLIAGATGSGKSVCVNTIITSILYKARPDEVKLLLIDPKVVELGIYNGIPHLLIPVVTDPQKAASALNWAVKEMTRRYELFAENNVRDMKGYNESKIEKNETDLLPQIVIIIDELADLMMVSSKEVESSICRLAQMARAAGLYLIIATQRPSVDVITGLIKANVPSRLAFSVSSGTDSRTILDMTGAEKLLGKGDMLFSPMGSNKPQRIQGAFISDKEVESVVAFIKQNKTDEVDPLMIEEITCASKFEDDDEEMDEFFEPSINLIMKKGKASTSMLQRQFRIGYNRAARIMEELEARGIVGPEDGSKPRQILMTNFEWEKRKENKM